MPLLNQARSNSNTHIPTRPMWPKHRSDIMDNGMSYRAFQKLGRHFESHANAEWMKIPLVNESNISEDNKITNGMINKIAMHRMFA